MTPTRKSLSIWYVLGPVLVLLALQTFVSVNDVEVLPYSDFKALLGAGKIEEAIIGSEEIRGLVSLEGIENLLPEDRVKAITHGTAANSKNAQGRIPFLVRRVDDPQLTSALENAKVRYMAANENRWFSMLLSWVLPSLVFVAIWSFFLRRSGGGQMGSLMGVGRSNAKVYVQTKTGVQFSDVAGIDEAKDELMEVVEFLRNPERYRRLGGKIPKGVLIVGAPGTGKTLLAKAVAGEAGVSFLSISGSEFVEMFVGVGAARVRDLFAQAEKKAPCIIFIDELDALGKARGLGGLSGAHEEREQTLNQLLVEMDGFDERAGVIIMAATNRPEILDPALLRPGRFDRHIAIDRPDVRGREAILRVHIKDVPLSADVILGEVAAKTAGLAGADLANIVNEAALRAARDNKPAVGMEDFDAAIDRVIGGLEKRTRVMNAMERQTVAYHEAGHALIAESRPHADHVSKISIIPRGISALGYTQQLPTGDRYLLKRSELLDRLDVLLGGRVAEEIVFGDVSTGAQNDLDLASDMARHMVMQYGMSKLVGNVTFGPSRKSAFLNIPDETRSVTHSEKTAQLIDEEIASLINESRVRVMNTLNEKRSILDQLATMLLEHEVVNREQIGKLLHKSSTPVAIARQA